MLFARNKSAESPAKVKGIAVHLCAREYDCRGCGDPAFRIVCPAEYDVFYGSVEDSKANSGCGCANQSAYVPICLQRRSDTDLCLW